jgi:EpsI family protein
MMAAVGMKKAWILALAMACTAVSSALFTPRPQALAQERAQMPLEHLFPEQFGHWRLDPAASALIRPAFEQARQFQMYDQVLERTYVNAEGRRMMLSVAYGRQQSVGLQMHLPEVCYKAGGFHVQDVEAGTVDLNGAKLPVTRLFASMDARPEPITYWRLLGDDVISDETQFKLRQISLGATGVIPDGMLVRVSSVDADVGAAHALQASFVQEMAAAMTAPQRTRVLGQSR